ncbi:MAG: Ig-like domain-containing protein [Candidatus Onthomonas sp.]
MRKTLMTRILSMLLLVSLLFTEASPAMAYALETADPLLQAETATEEELPPEQPEEEPSAAPEEGTEATEQEGESSELPDQPGEETEEPSEQEPAPEIPAEEENTEEPPAPEEPASEEAPAVEEPTAEELAEQEAMAELEQILQRAMAMRSSDADYSYETELKKFPSSYQSLLKTLHEQHPDWVFVAVDTGLSWDEVIEGELGQKSTIDYNLNGETSHLLLNNHSDYYSSSSYSSTNGYKPIDSAHVSCSRAAIAYYMDPRNFMMDKYIFQFEDQRYNSNVQTLTGVKTILKNACSKSTGLYHMTDYITTAGKTATLASLKSEYGDNYSEIIYNVGLAIGISPYFMASKIAQETGADTTNGSICGDYSYDGVSYTGYYNFYNIGAYASSNGGAIAKGLAYAKDKGWSNPILAIYGGAEYIYNQYIGKGQNTSYYMRFNVGPEAEYSLYSHQYMSAIYAVAAEATKTYNAYEEVGAVDNAFLFFIPVFDNMPDQSSTVSMTPTTQGTTTAEKKLYSGPSTSTSAKVTVPEGATVTVLGGAVTTTDNYNSRLAYPYWYQVKVTVSGTSYTGYIQEQFVTLSSVYNVKKGDTLNISSIVSTSGKTGTLYYETSDPDVATVSDSGVITAKSNGKCSIYVISGGGSFDAIGITVSSSATSSVAAGKPATPELTGISNVNGGVRVKWECVSNADGYRVYRKADGETSWTRIANISSGSTGTYTDKKNISNNTTYTYTVRAENDAGLSSYDTDGLQILYLDVPQLVEAKAEDVGICVRWKPVTGAVSYDLYRKTDSGSWQKLVNLKPIGSGTQGYVDGTAQKGTSYRYTLRARSSSSVSYYDTSGVTATAATTNLLVNGYTTAKLNYRTGAGTSYSAVGTLSAGARIQVIPGTSVSSGGSTWYQVRVNGDGPYYVDGAYVIYNPVLNSASNIVGGIRVTWGAQPGADSYAVYRKTGSSGWTKLDTVTTNRYDDKTASSGTTYIYTVRAIKDSRISSYDQAGISCLYLAAPSLTGAEASGNSIQVTWGKVSGATGYNVYRKTADSKWSKIASVSSGSEVSYTDTSADLGITYTYTVRATKGSAISSYHSKGVSAKLSGTVTLENQVTREKSSYYATTSTSAGAAGTLSAGKTVKVVSGWTKTEGGITWRKIQVDDSYYYISANNLLVTPELTKAANVSGGVRVTWEEVSNGDGYTVWRKTEGKSWSKIATLTSNSKVSYDDTTAASGTTYIYTVRATYGSVQSRYETAGISCLCLTVPKLGTAKASSSGISLSWDKVSGADGYRVYRKTSGESWQLIAKTTAASYTDKKNVISGTTYIYTVRAYSGSTLSYYNTKGVSATATSTVGVTLVDYVTTGDLNYRSSPDKSSSSNIVGTLKKGTTVKVVDGWSKTVEDTTWFMCYIDGNYYYISSKYLEKA